MVTRDTGDVSRDLAQLGVHRALDQPPQGSTLPPALLAAVLSVVAGTPELAWAIVAVGVLNAVFSFVQEGQAGRAVEALGRFLPSQAQVRRDGVLLSVPATVVVSGDVLVLAEGDRCRPTHGCCRAGWRSRRSPARPVPFRRSPVLGRTDARSPLRWALRTIGARGAPHPASPAGSGPWPGPSEAAAVERAAGANLRRVFG